MSKPAEVEKESHERWVLSYADLVTLLLGFFIILYATSDLDIQKFESISLGLAKAFNVDVKQSGIEGSAVLEGGRGIIPDTLSTTAIDADLERIREMVREQSEAKGIGIAEIVVTRDAENIIIRLADSLLFPSASAAIREDALPLLDVVGFAIEDLSNQIRVEGHTDNVPVGTERYPTNWELSSARATAVLRYLVEQTGLEAGRVFAAGFGEFRPEMSNLTPEGRAVNRRADIVILYPPGRLPAQPDNPFSGQNPFGQEWTRC